MTPDQFHDRWPLTGGHEGCCAFWEVEAEADYLPEMLVAAEALGFRITRGADGMTLIEE